MKVIRYLWRYCNSPSELAWWEWFLWPIVFPIWLFVLWMAMTIFVIGSFPWMIVQAFFIARNKRKLKSEYIQSGRFVPREKLESHLAAGNGTLVIESGKGWRRYWWTEEVIDDSHLPLPEDIDYGSEELRSVAKTCLEKYTDLTDGIALLTDGLDDLSETEFTTRFPRANSIGIKFGPRGPTVVKGRW